jgi:hypothetical protein
MRLEMRGKRVERAFDLSIVTVTRRRPTEPFDPGAALGIVGEETMHISSRHTAIR